VNLQPYERGGENIQKGGNFSENGSQTPKNPKD